MALIKCPECSNSVSEKATSCPKCGYPLDAPALQPPADLDALIKQTLSRQGKIAAIGLYRKYNPRVGLADVRQYVERLIRDNAIVVARRPRTGVVVKFIGWVGLAVCTVLIGIMLGKCSPESDPDYKAGRDFAFRLRYAEKYSFGSNQSLSEGDRDDMARSYVPKAISAERQEKWKEGFKSGLGF